MSMERHFVNFYSPGTFLAEETTKPIKSWDVEEAIRMSKDIIERHGARPYGFRFTTRSRSDDDLDSKNTASSPLYYLGGRIETIDEVRQRDDPKERVLLQNMESNRWDKIIVNDNSWRWTQPLQETDVVLSEEGKG